MKRDSTLRTGTGLLLAVAVLGLVVAGGRVEAGDDKDFEVWALDQSNSPGTTFGGLLYIYDGEKLIKDAGTAVPEVVDLGAAASALCREIGRAHV